MANITGTDAVIPFNALSRRIAEARPELLAAFNATVEGGNWILGPRVSEFEAAFARYCGVAHGVGVASGTDAIWIALEALGVGAGDEVITVANTCVPTISAILKCGATPALIDVLPGTLNMDPGKVKAAISPKTRCVLPVHLYGQCADLAPLQALADEAGIPLVEDCAQAHGSEYRGKRAGSMGRLSAFSFYPTKNLGALGDGGMVVTDDARLADKLRLLRQYGYQERNHSVLRGFNSRLDEIQAAWLLRFLTRLDGGNARRRAIAAAYTSVLAGSRTVSAPVAADYGRHNYHLYVVRTKDRDGLAAGLRRSGVETAVHYPVPIHLQKGCAEFCRVPPQGLPETEKACAEVLSLPMYPELRDDEVARICRALQAVDA